jgi:hypothetical protein
MILYVIEGLFQSGGITVHVKASRAIGVGSLFSSSVGAGDPARPHPVMPILIRILRLTPHKPSKITTNLPTPSSQSSCQMQKRHRTILPSTSRPDTVGESVDQQENKRRRTVRVACNNCRTKKVAVGQPSFFLFIHYMLT